MRTVKRNLHKVAFKRARGTEPKLIVAGSPLLPLVTWNTGGIDRLATRLMRVERPTHGKEMLLWGAIVLCVAVIVGSVLWGLWLLGGYAML